MRNRRSLQRAGLGATLSLAVLVMAMMLTAPTNAEQEPLSLDQGSEELVRQLAKKLKSRDIKTLAILNIIGPGDEATELGSWLESSIGEGLHRVLPETAQVERERLNRLLGEHELSGTGLIDRKTSAKPGKMFGADVFITGTVLAKNRRVLSVTLEAQSVETAERLAISTVEIDRATVDDGILVKRKRSIPRSSLNPSPGHTSGPIRLEVHSLQRPFHRKNVAAEVSLINLTNETLYVGVVKGPFGRCEMHLRDNSGESYLPVGDGRGSGIACVTKNANRSDYTTLPPGEKTAGLSFKANKDATILGEVFGVSIWIRLWTPEGPIRHDLDVNGLTLDTFD